LIFGLTPAEDPDKSPFMVNITFHNSTHSKNAIDPDLIPTFPFLGFSLESINSNGVPAVSIFATPEYLGTYYIDVYYQEILTKELYSL
jgi:hypothetical protein